MTTIKAMLNTDRKSVSGVYPLVIRVIHERRKRLIYTPYKLRIENFDTTRQQAVLQVGGLLSAKDVAQINHYIESQKVQLARIVQWLERHTDGPFSVNDILAKYGRNVTERYLFSYIDSEIEAKKQINNFGIASLYRTTRESIKRFTIGRKVTFSDITYKFITDYINHLHMRGLKRNTIHMYLRNFRLIYNKARKEGIVPAKTSPFTDIKMSGTETVKRSLAKEKIRNIAYADLSAYQELEMARDVFMFSFYTRGMSLVDMLHLKHSDIKNGIIYYARSKTNQYLQITITPPLQKLIDKYKTRTPYVLPYLKPGDHQSLYRQYRSAVGLINKHLKRVGTLLNIETPLTTYVARHSWATIAKNEGASISAISEGLGHTTEKTTRIYLRAFDRSVIDEVNEKVVML